MALVLGVSASMLPGVASADPTPKPTLEIPTTTGPPLTIMPIGDSITQGAVGTATYRCYLDGMLNDAGVAFDLVGSQSTPAYGTEYGCPTAFDQDHEGYWGGSISRVGSVATPSVEDLQPDVALIHLGTNDIYGGRDPAASASDLASLITELQGVSPDITILVAQIIPCDTEQAIPLYAGLCSDEDVGPAFNDAIAAFTSLSTDESSVIVVDMNTGFGLDYLRDEWHPNDAGDQFIASRWMTALQDAGLISTGT
jgi:lysophospholipase L1-like esterase